jgi:dihydrofolate synthase / folylpolyglutamate synthase
VSIIGTGAYGRALDSLSQRGPGRMVPDLDRITRLLALLGDPQRAFRSVHVTGTNGKGSIVRITSALTGAIGLRTGTYVSPHLQDVRERIMTGLTPVSTDVFASLHREVEQLAALVDDETRRRDGDDFHRVTFFELLTAMGFAHLADEAVDVGVIEVGLGGRWDATNVMDADVAVIGEVDLDHTMLGGTPEEIAREKVGIIKPGSNVVSAVQRPGVAAIVEAAVRDAGGELTLVDRDVVLLERRITAAGQLVDVELRGRRIEDLLLPLRGAHQARNLLAALGALEALLGPSLASVSDDVIRAGLAKVRVPGRLEVVSEQPTVVLDGAHNPHAARALATSLREDFRFRDVILVVACLADKDVEGILAELGDSASHVIVTASPSTRAADIERMVGAASTVFAPRGVHVEIADDVLEAIDLATAIVGPADAVVVTGSLTIVGVARERYHPIAEEAPVVTIASERATDEIRTLVVDVDGVPYEDAGDDPEGDQDGDDDGYDDAR